MNRRAVRIVGTGSYAPARILTNDDLAARMDTSDEWITQRSGIKERRISEAGEFPSDLGTRAALHALQAAGVEPGQIDLILCATSLPDYLFPSTACLIQKNLGASRAGAIDLNAACAGFLYAITLGGGLIASGRSETVLVIGTETLSKMVDWTDRTTAVLFGDSAGAVVIRPSDGESDFLSCELGADGSCADLIGLRAGGARQRPHAPGALPRDQFIHMQGREVYKIAVQKLIDLAQAACAKAKVPLSKVDLFIPHQMNQRIIESACERLGFPLAKTLINIQKYGNTSSASVPLALDEAVRAGRIRRGDYVLLVAIGAGLSWGSLLLRY